MQALIITAYQNGATLEKNLRVFAKYFQCYVHIDSKSNINSKEYIARLNKIDNVYAISKYKINWGSYLHMMAIYELLIEAAADEKITRVHIISGEDFPIKTIADFDDFFEKKHRYDNFLEVTNITNMPHLN